MLSRYLLHTKRPFRLTYGGENVRSCVVCSLLTQFDFLAPSNIVKHSQDGKAYTYLKWRKMTKSVLYRKKFPEAKSIFGTHIVYYGLRVIFGALLRV